MFVKQDKMAYNPLGSILEGQKDFCLSLPNGTVNFATFSDPSVGNGMISSLDWAAGSQGLSS